MAYSIGNLYSNTFLLLVVELLACFLYSDSFGNFFIYQRIGNTQNRLSYGKSLAKHELHASLRDVEPYALSTIFGSELGLLIRDRMRQKDINAEDASTQLLQEANTDTGDERTKQLIKFLLDTTGVPIADIIGTNLETGALSIDEQSDESRGRVLHRQRQDTKWETAVALWRKKALAVEKYRVVDPARLATQYTTMAAICLAEGASPVAVQAMTYAGAPVASQLLWKEVNVNDIAGVGARLQRFHYLSQDRMTDYLAENVLDYNMAIFQASTSGSISDSTGSGTSTGSSGTGGPQGRGAGGSKVVGVEESNFRQRGDASDVLGVSALKDFSTTATRTALSYLLGLHNKPRKEGQNRNGEGKEEEEEEEEEGSIEPLPSCLAPLCRPLGAKKRQPTSKEGGVGVEEVYHPQRLLVPSGEKGEYGTGGEGEEGGKDDASAFRSSLACCLQAAKGSSDSSNNDSDSGSDSGIGDHLGPSLLAVGFGSTPRRAKYPALSLDSNALFDLAQYDLQQWRGGKAEGKVGGREKREGGGGATVRLFRLSYQDFVHALAAEPSPSSSTSTDAANTDASAAVGKVVESALSSALYYPDRDTTEVLAVLTTYR